MIWSFFFQATSEDFRQQGAALFERAELLFAAGRGNDKGENSRRSWVDLIGSVQYNCYLCADFDPKRAIELYNEVPYHILAESLISKISHTYTVPDGKHR